MNMKYVAMITLLLSTFLMHQPAAASHEATTYNVVSLGAKPDGKSDSTKAFLRAWDSACKSEDPATIYVPPGTYLIGTAASFHGEHCKNTRKGKGITFRIEGTLVAPSDYRKVGSAGSWIKFERVSGVSIHGATLDGQGSRLWACKHSSSHHHCPKGSTNLAFYNSNDIVLNGVTSINSQKFHIVIDKCRNVMLQGTNVSASGRSPNTDGIHIEKSSGVTVLNSTIATGDDCISIGPGASDLWIEGVACGPGHGISIGSLGWKKEEPGVQNVTVKTANLTSTMNGVRIKTWARPSKGFVKGVVFQHLIMDNVKNPIIIDQNYCPHDGHKCPTKDSGVKINDVRFEDIRGTSATEVGVKLSCSEKNPCSKIKLDEIDLTYKDQPADASCVNAQGTTPHTDTDSLDRPSTCW